MGAEQTKEDVRGVEQTKPAEADHSLYTQACPTCRLLGVPHWCTDRIPKSRYDEDHVSNGSPRQQTEKSSKRQLGDEGGGPVFAPGAELRC